MQTLEEKKLELKSSDIYGKEYNKKIIYMPSPDEVLSKITLPISHIGLGSPTYAEKNGLDVKTYSTYVIETKMEDNTVISGYSGTIGMLVNGGLNKISLFSGATAHACTNLSIFGADHIKDYKFNSCIDNLEEVLNNMLGLMVKRLISIKEKKEVLENKTYTSQTFVDRKGQLVNNISLTLFDYVAHAEKVLRDKNSVYYDQPLNDWLLLSAMTDKIKHQSPMKRIEATLALENIFNN